MAQDILKKPENYKKPPVGLISDVNVPSGKIILLTVAVIPPGQEYGTFLDLFPFIDY